MKHKPVKKMLNDPDSILAEDIAQYAVFNTVDNDNDKCQNIVELIVQYAASVSKQNQPKQTISKTEKDNEVAIVNILQKALDYLHANITASVIYTDHYDYSRGVEGAEVDYFPGSVDELFTEMGITELKNIEPLYTRAQMIEFGEKVREVCADMAKLCTFKVAEVDNMLTHSLYRDGDRTIKVNKQSILSINIENLLNK